MLALSITDTKMFMQKLLLDTIFDRFLLVEGVIVTSNYFQIDGRFHKDFYSDETDTSDLADDGYSYWGSVKPMALGLIKGKNTPLSFTFTLRLNQKNTEKLLLSADTIYKPADVAGLFLNLRFENGRLLATTGTSLKIFSLDRSLDNAWDAMVKKYFIQQNISFDENQ